MSRARQRQRHHQRSGVITKVGLAVATIVFLGPLVFMIVGALKPGNRVLSESTSWKAFVPTNPSLHNLREAVHRGQFVLLLRNSVVVSATTVVLGLAVNSTFGYALARLRFRGRKLMLAAVIALSIVPFQAIAIPLLYLMSGWGWRNSFRGLVVPFVANPFFIYLFYSFFLDLPSELEEAAKLDGAGPLRIFWSIAVPLARPAFATVGILSFLASWGELLWPALITDDVNVRTLPLGVSVFRSVPPIDQGVILAFVLLAAVPTLALFVALQRHFIASVARSGIKG